MYKWVILHRVKMGNKDLLALLKSTPYYKIRIELLSARKNNLNAKLLLLPTPYSKDRREKYLLPPVNESLQEDGHIGGC